MKNRIVIVGGGLAGVEAAWHLAGQGFFVSVIEMRPKQTTPAHHTEYLAELVCSNSLRAESAESAVGLLKREMSAMGSIVIETALETRVPAGKALAVDRDLFGKSITEKIKNHPNIEIVNQEISKIPEDCPVIIATGPLTADDLAEDIGIRTGLDNLHFYDAIAPIVEAESIDYEKTFFASRWMDPEEEADYLNCPMTEQQYNDFYNALLEGDKVEPKAFEKPKYFEGCLPIEVMAERGIQTLTFGPLKPVGLVDPNTGKRPFACVQLRKEDKSGDYYNLVGFQTKLTYEAQKKVFRLIPGLENAVFTRFGSIHRNTFICGPQVLNQDLTLKECPDVYLAGQITGVEGYVESAANGIMAGFFLSRKLNGKPFTMPPPDTAMGALLRHVTESDIKNFQPSNVHFGMFPPFEKKIPKKNRKEARKIKAEASFGLWLDEIR